MRKIFCDHSKLQNNRLMKVVCNQDLLISIFITPANTPKHTCPPHCLIVFLSLLGECVVPVQMHLISSLYFALVSVLQLFDLFDAFLYLFFVHIEIQTIKRIDSRNQHNTGMHVMYTTPYPRYVNQKSIEYLSLS